MMMNYESFKKEVVPEIEKMARLGGYEVSSVFINKVNYEVETLRISRQDNNEHAMLGLKDAYEHYQRTGNLLKAVSEIFHLIALNPSASSDMSYMKTKKEVLDNVIIALINTEFNEKLLSGIPSREYLNLSIVYKRLIKEDKEGMQSILITNEHIEELGITEEELYSKAYKNTYQRGYSIRPIESVINKFISMGIINGVPVIDVPYDFNTGLLVVSSLMGVGGSSLMAINEVLEKLADVYKDNFYIFPSSLHEFIATDAKNVDDVGECQEMVRDINAAMVSEGEFLSDEVYYYDKSLGKLFIAESEQATTSPRWECL